MYCNGYVPSISGMDYGISSGSFDANTLNIATFFYDGQMVFVNIGNVPTLEAPTLTIEAGNTIIDANWTSVTGATNYVLEYDTNSDFSTATEAYSGALLTYQITGLTNTTLYYVRVKAEGTGQIDSGYDSDSATPIVGNILYQDDMDTFDSVLWTAVGSSGAWDGAVAGKYQWTEPSVGTGLNVKLDCNGKQEVTTFGETTVIKFDLGHHGVTPCGEFTVQFYSESPVDNFTVYFLVQNSTTMKYQKTGTGIVDSLINASGSWKMVLNGDGTMSYHHWNGSTWDTIDTSTYTSNGTDRRYPIITLDETGGGQYADGEIITLDNWYITDYDYSTLNP